jgi:dCMP deaminase
LSPLAQPTEVLPKHQFKEGSFISRGGVKFCDVPGCGRPMSDLVHHILDKASPGQPEEVLPVGVPRFTRDQLLMGMAELVRRRSTCLRGQVGVVIARDGRVVSTGYNGSPPGFAHCTDVGCEPADGCERTIHAESNALVFAARNGVATDGAAMYSTHSPCRVCAQLIVAGGIVEFHYMRAYREERLDILTAGKIKIVQHGVD